MSAPMINVPAALRAFSALPATAKASRRDMRALASTFQSAYLSDVFDLLWACWNGHFHEARRLHDSTHDAESVFQTARSFRTSICPGPRLPRQLRHAIIRDLQHVPSQEVPATVAFMVKWFGSMTCDDFCNIITNSCESRSKTRLHIVRDIQSKAVQAVTDDALRVLLNQCCLDIIATWPQKLNRTFKVRKTPEPNECQLCYTKTRAFICNPTPPTDCKADAGACNHFVCVVCACKWIKKTKTSVVPYCPFCTQRYDITDSA